MDHIDIEQFKVELNTLVLAGYRIDIENPSVLKVWFEALNRFSVDQIAAGVKTLVESHETATVRPYNLRMAITGHPASQGSSPEDVSLGTGEPESVEAYLKRGDSPLSVEQYTVHRHRMDWVMMLRLRNSPMDALIRFLRTKKDVDPVTGEFTDTDQITNEILKDELATVRQWFDDSNNQAASGGATS